MLCIFRIHRVTISSLVGPFDAHHEYLLRNSKCIPRWTFPKRSVNEHEKWIWLQVGNFIVHCAKNFLQKVASLCTPSGQHLTQSNRPPSFPPTLHSLTAKQWTFCEPKPMSVVSVNNSYLWMSERYPLNSISLIRSRLSIPIIAPNTMTTTMGPNVSNKFPPFCFGRLQAIFLLPPSSQPLCNQSKCKAQDMRSICIGRCFWINPRVRMSKKSFHCEWLCWNSNGFNELLNDVVQPDEKCN